MRCVEAAAARLLFRLAHERGLTVVDAWSRQHMLREMGVVMDDE